MEFWSLTHFHPDPSRPSADYHAGIYVGETLLCATPLEVQPLSDESKLYIHYQPAWGETLQLTLGLEKSLKLFI